MNQTKSSQEHNKSKKIALIAEQISQCQKCPLAKERTNTVPGDGNLHAEIMFVGEAPGKNEDEQGIPFVGAAGRVLNEMLGHIGMKREDIFITNTVKCRPPNNRDPEITEKNTCFSFLKEQIETIDPAVIITLGKHAMEYFLPDQKISEIHGQPKLKIWPDGTKRIIYPIYHPAACLYNPRTKTQLQEDFYKLPYIIKKIRETNLDEYAAQYLQKNNN